jgi:hypothetical protein
VVVILPAEFAGPCGRRSGAQMGGGVWAGPKRSSRHPRMPYPYDTLATPRQCAAKSARLRLAAARHDLVVDLC